ncbi:multiple epidermal growth factor-like domains protein 10 isoform X2 [Pomacea canaliculata]|uniref:multiple epidermal growth factor-like domains protein 10 isoform X2 n=1 Tax=Pomacea canaliculata TaxID=400727 RepID=UPI000D72B095|nr:multiple epidermal growth factor-like domains protein 10 isoform X2 [Pomacea canaliculata]
MADCRCVQVFMFCVFTQIFLLCVAQDTHMQNVAKYKPCEISSLYASSNNCSAAINGNTSTYYQYKPPNCVHTTEDDKSPFWWVDLGEEVTISIIMIYGRGNLCDDGWYDDCSKSCGQCDNNMSCDKVNGTCASCQTGFHPPLCQECADGYYETTCSQTLGKCGSNSVCNNSTGTCTSCQTGFNSPLCKAGMSYDNDKETVSVAGPVAGAAVVCAVVFFIIGAIFGW